MATDIIQTLPTHTDRRISLGDNESPEIAQGNLFVPFFFVHMCIEVFLPIQSKSLLHGNLYVELKFVR